MRTRSRCCPARPSAAPGAALLRPRGASYLPILLSVAGTAARGDPACDAEDWEAVAEVLAADPGSPAAAFLRDADSLEAARIMEELAEAVGCRIPHDGGGADLAADLLFRAALDRPADRTADGRTRWRWLAPAVEIRWRFRDGTEFGAGGMSREERAQFEVWLIWSVAPGWI